MTSLCAKGLTPLWFYRERAVFAFEGGGYSLALESPHLLKLTTRRQSQKLHISKQSAMRARQGRHTTRKQISILPHPFAD